MNFDKHLLNDADDKTIDVEQGCHSQIRYSNLVISRCGPNLNRKIRVYIEANCSNNSEINVKRFLCLRLKVTIVLMKSAMYIKIGPRRIRSQMVVLFDRLLLRPTKAVPGVGKRDDGQYTPKPKRPHYHINDRRHILCSLRSFRSFI